MCIKPLRLLEVTTRLLMVTRVDYFYHVQQLAEMTTILGMKWLNEIQQSLEISLFTAQES